MDIKYFQKGFNYSQDGPGNRLVIHLQGCNLRCPWCSNPEGMSASGGKTVSVEDLANEIISCKRLFFDGGGVTFTGGECTLQKSALIELFKILKQNQIHIAIETNGTCEYDSELFSLIDYLISDFKHYDVEKLKSVVGVKENQLKNVSDYIKKHKAVLIRTVLINGFNASEKDAENFALFFSKMACDDVKFEFLPYHEYGKQKWQALNKTYVMKDAFVTRETVSMFERTFNKYKLKTIRS